MEATPVTPPVIAKSATHPLLLIAAASVTALSIAGVAALAGWLPGPGRHNAEPVPLMAMAKAAPVATTAETPTAPPRAVTAIEEKQTSAPRPATSVSPRVRAKVPAKTLANADGPATVHSTPPLATNPPVAVPPAPTFSGLPPPPPICRECGVVQAVNEVAVEAKGSGGGAVAGGLLGGILGNQIGKGGTRDIATILGAVGGAYAGNHVEKSSKQGKRYDVVVRFEDGSSRIFSSEAAPIWQSGDRVRLQNGALTMGWSPSSANSGAI